MALCGLGSAGGDTCRPLAPRDGLRTLCRAMCLSLCGTHTFEMSNACLVGPSPVPNHSDWPARAVCAPRWFCRSGRVAGALSFRYMGMGLSPTPVPCPGSLPREVGGKRELLPLLGFWETTTPPLARTTGLGLRGQMGGFANGRGAATSTRLF